MELYWLLILNFEDENRKNKSEMFDSKICIHFFGNIKGFVTDFFHNLAAGSAKYINISIW